MCYIYSIIICWNLKTGIVKLFQIMKSKPHKISIKILKRSILSCILPFLCILLLSIPDKSFAGEITVDIGSDYGSSYYPPICTYFYYYTYSQQIYLQSELNPGQEISIDQIAFHYQGAAWSQDIVVYMGNTSKSTFSSGTDWVSTGSMTQVYSGSYTVSTNGWYTITLDNPFTYNNSDNLVIAVDENDLYYPTATTNYFWNNYLGVNRGLYWYGDSPNPSPSSPPAGALYAYRPKLWLHYTTVATTAPVAGSGDCLSFDGTTDYVSIPSYAITGSAWTLEFWIKPNSMGANDRIFLQGSGAYSLRQIMAVWDDADDQIEFMTDTDGSGGVAHVASSTITDNNSTWTHVAWTSNNNVYVNGVSSTGSLDGTANYGITGNMYIGCRTGSQNYMNGSLDEVRVWSDVRTLSEVQDNMYNALTGSESNLVLYYRFDEGSGSTANDDAGTASNGTITGATFAASEAWKNRTTDYDTPLTFSAGYDPNDDPLSFSITEAATRGTLVFDTVNNEITYFSDIGESGTDGFTFQLDDGSETDAYAMIVTVNSGSVNMSPVAGSGNCLEFDGVDDYILLPNGSMVTSAWTLEFWIKPNSPGNSERIFLQGEDGYAGRQIMALWDTDHLEFRTSTSGAAGTPQIATGTIADDNSTWTHVAWTYNGSTHKAYVNGRDSSGTVIGSNLGITGPSYIGTWAADGAKCFTGCIDEVRLWSDDLTQAEIADSMYVALSGAEANLVGYWRLDESSGDYARDYSGDDNHGLLVNMTDADWVASTAWKDRTAYTGVDLVHSAGYDPEAAAVTVSGSVAPSQGSYAFNSTNRTVTYTPPGSAGGPYTYTYQIADSKDRASDTYQMSVTVLQSSTAEDYDDWTYSQKVYINTTGSGADVSNDVSDFPLLIRLTSTELDFSQCKTDGTDLRFSKSDGTHLYYERERWDNTNDLAEFWVDVPTVTGNNNTQYIKMYWGKADAGDSSKSEEVFNTSDNFAAVWHLNNSINDATSNNNDGTNYNSTNTTGNIGEGRNFDGTDDYITFGNGNSLKTISDEITVSYWLKTSENPTSGYISIVRHDLHFTALQLDGSTAPKGMTVSWISGDNIKKWNWNGEFNDNSWHYFTARYDNANGLRVFKDGVSHYSDATLTGSLDITTTKDFVIGASETGSEDYTGFLDEVRVDNTERSADWIKLCYETQKPDQNTVTFVLTGTEDYNQWQYSKNAYINTTGTGADVSGDVSDFPLLIRLTSDELDFSQCKSDGTDLRFSTSGGAHLYYERERWDNTNDLAEFWVNVPTVTGNNSTQYITMYWGKSDAADSSNSEAVFDTDNDFAGVWHLHGTDYTDATLNSNDASNSGSSDAAGNIAYCQDFDGVNDYLNAGSGSSLDNISTLTMSAWIYADGWGESSFGRIFDKGGYLIFLVSNAGTPTAYLESFGITRARATTETLYRASNSTLSLSQWYYVTVVMNGTTNTDLYKNGTETSYGSSLTLGSGSLTSEATSSLYIGNTSATDRTFNGKIDELRIENSCRSSDWIKLCYETQKQGQITVTFPEDYNDWNYSMDFYINTTSTGADVPGDVLEFPLLVRLNEDIIDFDQAETDGADIRFSTSDGTPLLYERERWDNTNDLAEFWVLVPTVTGNNSTQYITMYWGKSGADDVSSSEAVFTTSNGFAGVWHVAASDFTDATSNDNDGTNSGSADADGVIGKGKDFDAVGADYINAGSKASLDNLGTVTTSAWIYPRSWGEDNYGRIWAKDNSVNLFFLDNSVTYGVESFAFKRDRGSGLTNTDARAGDNSLDLNEWTYVTAVMNGTSSTKLYVNDAEVGSYQQQNAGSGTLDSDASLNFIIGNSSDGLRAFNGIIDELRVDDAVRTDDWIKLCYETQKIDQNSVIPDTVNVAPVAGSGNALEFDGGDDYASIGISTESDLQVPTSVVSGGEAAGQSYEDYAKWTIPGSGTVSLTKLHWYDYQGTLSGSESIQMAIYAGSAGGARLSEIVTQSGNGSIGWVEGTLATPIDITLGTTYYFGVGPSGSPLYATARDYLADDANYLPNEGSRYLAASGGIDATVPTGTVATSKYGIWGITYSQVTNTDYDITSALTVEAWIKVSAFDKASQTIISKGNTAWKLQRSASTNYLEFVCTGLTTNTTVTGDVNVNDGEWHHVAGVYNGSTLKLYIDGVEDNSVTATGSISTNEEDFTIGENAEQTGRQWEGFIDEVRIWNDARTASEISNNMYKPLDGDETGLVGYWRMDASSGTTLKEYTSNANDATLNNMTDADWVESNAWTYRSVDSDTTLTIDAGYDEDGDDVTIGEVDAPNGGNLSIDNNTVQLTYTPTCEDFTDTFSYELSDGPDKDTFEVIVDIAGEDIHLLPLTVVHNIGMGDVDTCSILTDEWRIVFDEALGAGIGWLSYEGSRRKRGDNELNVNTNLFYIHTDNINSYSVSGGLSQIDSNSLYCKLHQSVTINSHPWDIEYTVYGSGKVFIRVETEALWSAYSPANGVEFRVETDVQNKEYFKENTSASQSNYILHSDKGSGKYDVLLGLYEDWGGANGFTATSGDYYGIVGDDWSLTSGKKQVWEFMLDFGHRKWNDTSGVGCHVDDYRTPDSLELARGTFRMEKAWEEWIGGHWRFDNTPSFEEPDMGARPVPASFMAPGAKQVSVAPLRAPYAKQAPVSLKAPYAKQAPSSLKTGYESGHPAAAQIKQPGVLYSLDDGDTAYDYSGTGHHGILKGGTWETGKWNGGLTFNGATDSVAIINAADFDGPLVFTIMAWIKKTGTSESNALIFGKHNPAVGEGYKLTCDSDKLKITLYDIRLTGNTSLGEDWRHVAVSFNRHTGWLKLFVDGKPDAIAVVIPTTTASTVKASIGNDFTGTIDDVRFYHKEVSEETIRAISQNGYRVDEGKYMLRATNNNTIELRIDGTTARPLRFPVFQIANYWAADTPKVVNYDGSWIATSDYLVTLDDANNLLTIGFDKKVITTDLRIFIDDKDSSGAYLTGPMPKMYWDAGTDVSVQNFDGAVFGTTGSNEFYLYWDQDGLHDGEITTFTSSELSPTETAASATPNLTPASEADGTFGYHDHTIASAYASNDHVTSGISFTVLESSDVRIRLKTGDRWVNTNTYSISTEWTIYPTGQIFRWDSVDALSGDNTYALVVFRQIYGTSSTPYSPDADRRGGRHTSSGLHDFAVGFLSGMEGGVVSSDIFENPMDILGQSSSPNYAGLEFRNNATGWPTADDPYKTTFYMDIRKQGMNQDYIDSVCRGVQDIDYNQTDFTTGNWVDTARGDMDGDGFDEAQGCYVMRASDNSINFKLEAAAVADGCRFEPALRILNYFASTKPKYVYLYMESVDTVALIEGYGYNCYLNTTSNELVMQLDTVLCADTRIYISCDDDLAVVMSDFYAKAGDGKDTLFWRTESEEDNLGFFLYRRISREFLDSLGGAVDSITADSLLDNAGILLKQGKIGYADTAWVSLTKDIIPSAYKPGDIPGIPRDYKKIDRDVENDVLYEYKLVAIDRDRSEEVFGPVPVMPKINLPKKFFLFHNFPNPARFYTNFRFDLPAKSKVALYVYNLQGRLVARIIKPNKYMKPGFHRLRWKCTDEHGRKLASGPYVYRFVATRASKKRYAKNRMMILIK